MRYVNVVIDNKSKYTDQFYTYGCDIDDVHVGSKVKVSFGRGKKLKDAYVFEEVKSPASGVENLKNIESIDDEVSLTKETIELCRWMRGRYLCRYMEAVKLFLPAGSKSKRGSRRDPLKNIQGEKQDIKELTDEQKAVLHQMTQNAKKAEHEIFLLHGVTGSGKTEVYMRLIEKYADLGKTAIMLVPEISLTKQILDRFVARFGKEKIAVLHSRLSAGERYDEWQRIRSGEAKIIIGARSAIFAPCEDVGIVIMDEEHESTYKSDMSPKYETLELAIKRTKKNGGIVVMGSATPSVVSYYRCKQGIYTLLELKKRYNEVQLPDVQICDMRKELQAGNTTMISRQLFSDMERAFADGEQVILFMNRRGYETFVSCRECGYVMKCPKCDISLTYHKNEDRCVCHYCDYKEPMPKVCPECGSGYIKGFGAGTEKVAETIAELFPGKAIERLDLDAMKKKGNLEKILERFRKKEIDVLIGTQVVAKGLDFRNVGLVGVVSCDVLLNIPDYRAPEQAFQLITQAAGRAGRGEKRGKVDIQTYTPGNYAIKAAAEQNYNVFYEEELAARRKMLYPPFADIIQAVFSSDSERDVNEIAKKWESYLIREGIPGVDIVRMSGYRKYEEGEAFKECIMVKCPAGTKSAYMKRLALLKESDREEKTNYSVIVDVNPYSLWRS